MELFGATGGARVMTFVAALLGAVVLLAGTNWLLLRREQRRLGTSRSLRPLVMLLATAVVAVVLVLAMPVDSATRQQLLGLIGLVATGVMAMSSTSFVANAMAGLMLRAVRNFSPGDFVRVGEHFGRVTERGIFHTEIQTEDRDLTTLPNLHLVTNPVNVVLSSGTIVSVSVSLGYDVGRKHLEPLLVLATEDAGLQGGFVQVLDLLDHAVVYRVAGFLPEVTELLAVRSRLRAAILDRLHGSGIEIVSPSFMNQRPIAPNELVIPTAAPVGGDDRDGRLTAETMAFDKAERAVQVEKFRADVAALNVEIEGLERERKDAADTTGEEIQARIDELAHRRDRLSAAVKAVAESEEDS